MTMGETMHESPQILVRSPVRAAKEILAPIPANYNSQRSGHFCFSETVGNYVIGRKLGEGSFGQVREGLHTVTREKVAVKVIDKQKARKDIYIMKNLRREAIIHQKVHHPNIVKLLEVLETEDKYYMVMELCPEGSLLDQLHKKKRMEETEVQRYIRQLVAAVGYMHQAGVVHRDLKLENLLLNENNIKIIDFGLSNCAGKGAHPDIFSTHCGTPAYSAPEVFSHNYGPKVDVWSIGVIMYALLTGVMPFYVEPYNLQSLRQKMLNKEMHPLPPEISQAAVGLLKSLLEPDPENRPCIQKVMGDPWVNLSTSTCRNRSPLEDINPHVVLHMTEKMGFQRGKVLHVVIGNMACHTLAVYFLLNRRVKRQSKLQRKNQTLESKEMLKVSKRKQTPVNRCLTEDHRPRAGPHCDYESLNTSCTSPHSPRPIVMKETHFPATVSPVQDIPKLAVFTSVKAPCRNLVSTFGYKRQKRIISPSELPLASQPCCPLPKKVRTPRIFKLAFTLTQVGWVSDSRGSTELQGPKRWAPFPSKGLTRH